MTGPVIRGRAGRTPLPGPRHPRLPPATRKDPEWDALWASEPLFNRASRLPPWPTGQRVNWST